MMVVVLMMIWKVRTGSGGVVSISALWHQHGMLALKVGKMLVLLLLQVESML